MHTCSYSQWVEIKPAKRRHEPGGKIRLGNLAFPLEGKAVLAEADLIAAHTGRTVEAVLRILLTAPDHLHWFLQRLGDRHCLRNKIPFSTPPESAS